MNKYLIILIGAAFIVSPQLNTFGSVTYFNKPDFLADTAAQSQRLMESFEQLPVDNAPGVLEEDSMPCRYQTLALPNFTLVAESETLSVADLDRIAGMHSIDGTQYVIHYYGTHQTYTHQLDIYFDTPTNVFGVTITDWGDADIGTFTFSNNSSDQFTVASGSQPNDNDIFFGIIGTAAFNHVTLSHDNIGDSYSIDEVYHNIPEPAIIPAPPAILLGFIGIGCVRWLRRRRIV